MVGKNPHRPEGKAKDNERQEASRNAGASHASPSAKEVHRQNMEAKERGGGPTRFPAEEDVGGSRPGVPSRVKDAIERVEARDEP